VSFEYVLHKSFVAPTYLARLRSAIIASYSTWLLDISKLKRRDCSMRMSLGPYNTTPALTPCGFEESSTCIVHQVSWVRGCS